MNRGRGAAIPEIASATKDASEIVTKPGEISKKVLTMRDGDLIISV